jgi:hypothetical protein
MNDWKQSAKNATIVALVFLVLYYVVPALWYQIVLMFAYRGEVG